MQAETHSDVLHELFNQANFTQRKRRPSAFGLDSLGGSYDDSWSSQDGLDQTMSTFSADTPSCGSQDLSPALSYFMPGDHQMKSPSHFSEGLALQDLIDTNNCGSVLTITIHVFWHESAEKLSCSA